MPLSIVKVLTTILLSVRTTVTLFSFIMISLPEGLPQLYYDTKPMFETATTAWTSWDDKLDSDVLTKIVDEQQKLAQGSEKPEYWRIKIPYIKPVIIANCILVLNGSLRSFEYSYLLTGGGPGNSSELMTTYMYKQAFSSMKYGYGSAVAIVIVIICLVVGLLFRRFIGEGES